MYISSLWSQKDEFAPLFQTQRHRGNFDSFRIRGHNHTCVLNQEMYRRNGKEYFRILITETLTLCNYSSENQI